MSKFELYKVYININMNMNTANIIDQLIIEYQCNNYRDDSLVINNISTVYDLAVNLKIDCPHYFVRQEQQGSSARMFFKSVPVNLISSYLSISARKTICTIRGRKTISYDSDKLPMHVVILYNKEIKHFYNMTDFKSFIGTITRNAYVYTPVMHTSSL